VLQMHPLVSLPAAPNRPLAFSNYIFESERVTSPE
jgi:hypothetical protein